MPSETIFIPPKGHRVTRSDKLIVKNRNGSLYKQSRKKDLLYVGEHPPENATPSQSRGDGHFEIDEDEHREWLITTFREFRHTKRRVQPKDEIEMSIISIVSALKRHPLEDEGYHLTSQEDPPKGDVIGVFRYGDESFLLSKKLVVEGF